MEVVIEQRFNGPSGSANGGYTCGLVATVVGGPCAEVTLRVPPPLGRPLRVERGLDGSASLFDGAVLVAEGRSADLEALVPDPVTYEEASRAADRYAGFREHAFPTCFVCGPERAPGDGLRIFAGPVEGRDELVAAPWTPMDAAGTGAGIPAALVWAALDCPGAFAVGHASTRGEVVLGRLRACVLERPVVGEPCVVLGWPVGEDGRKLYAGTALFTAEAKVLAYARATWIEPAAKRPVREADQGRGAAKRPVRAADQWRGSGGTGRFPQ